MLSLISLNPATCFSARSTFEHSFWYSPSRAALAGSIRLYSASNWYQDSSTFVLRASSSAIFLSMTSVILALSFTTSSISSILTLLGSNSRSLPHIVSIRAFISSLSTRIFAVVFLLSPKRSLMSLPMGTPRCWTE